ncbi:hypothetical protein WJX75_002608 [Coccomyxa subellipsoidea]|uniref:Patatin n=1 Tax=Coccomyxa subellipsoidea TaxID=248742 RepID=A0ABR2YV40_9CHLO
MQKQRGGWGLAGLREALRRVLPYIIVAETEIPKKKNKAISRNASKKIRYLKVKRAVQRKTILSIDGGGLRGLIPAMELECLEDVTRDEIVENSQELQVDDESELRTIPNSADDFYIHLADYFDVMAGTSTGGLVATFLATKGAKISEADKTDSPLAEDLDKLLQTLPTDSSKTGGKNSSYWVNKYTNAALRQGTAVSLQAIFLSRANSIFPKPNFQKPKFIDKFLPPNSIFQPQQMIAGAMWGLNRPKYSVDGLKNTVNMLLGDMKLKDARISTSLVVQSFELDYNRPFTFWYSRQTKVSGYATLSRALTKVEEDITEAMGRLKPPQKGQVVYKPDFAFFEGVDVALEEVVRATSAAPTFFPAAIVELAYRPRGKETENVALRKANWEAVTLQDTATLSLGTGQSVSSSILPDPDAGIYQWLKTPGRLIDILMESPAQIQTALGEYLLYENFGLHKMQFLRLQTRAITMSGADKSDGVDTDRRLASGQLPSEVLKDMDNADAIWDLLELEERSADAHCERLREFVRFNLFPGP